MSSGSNHPSESTNTPCEYTACMLILSPFYSPIICQSHSQDPSQQIEEQYRENLKISSWCSREPRATVNSSVCANYKEEINSDCVVWRSLCSQRLRGTWGVIMRGYSSREGMLYLLSIQKSGGRWTGILAWWASCYLCDQRPHQALTQILVFSQSVYWTYLYRKCHMYFTKIST